MLYSNESQGLGSLANWWCFQTLTGKALSYIYIHRSMYMYTHTHIYSGPYIPALTEVALITVYASPRCSSQHFMLFRWQHCFQLSHTPSVHPLQDAPGKVGRDCSARWHFPTGTKHLQQQSGSEGLNQMLIGEPRK